MAKKARASGLGARGRDRRCGFAADQSGNPSIMSIDLHETAATTQKAAKRAQKRAIKGVEAARAVDLHVPDLHVPATAAKKAAKHAAKAAAKEAAKRTAGVKRHSGRKQKARGGSKLLRFLLVAATAGALAGIAVTIARRQAAGNKGLAVGDTPDPFGAAVNATDGIDADALLRHAESPG